MLKQIGIENFKAFADLQEIDLAPITLIYGANSSGKSSIIHSLMVLKQSILFPSLKGGVYSDKRILDVGSYATMVYAHKLDRDICFNLKFTSNSTKSVYKDRLYVKLNYSFFDHEQNKKNKNDSQGFSYLNTIYFEGEYRNKFGYVLKNKFNGKSELSTKNFDLDLLDNYKIFDRRKKEISDEITKKIMDVFVYYAEEESPIPKGIGIDGSRHLEILDSLRENDSEDALYTVHSFIYETIMENSNYIKDELKKISYLGPLRSNPKRYYSIDTEFEVTVGKEGENIAYFLKSKKEFITHKINECFKKFNIPYKFTPKPIGERNSEPLIQIELEDLRNNVTVSPLDVGFGIGQILPILVEGVIRENSVICVEQPEIHLHPKLQAELAEFFAETCTKNQWIIETHSEALMLRIQKLIRDKKKINGRILKPKDVSILYVVPSEDENGKEGAKIKKIRLDEDGDFMDFWPEGFFEERIKERR